MKFEYVRCELCGKDDTELLFRQRDLLTHITAEFAVVRCRNCSLVYVNPRPTLQEIDRFYPESFISYQFDMFYPERNVSLRDRIVSLITRTASLQRIRTVQKWVKLEPDLKVIDIGCGKGAFIYYLREYCGCDVTGIDFDENSVKYCREKLNLSVLQGTITGFDNLIREYDLVTMWHFLEHEFHPFWALCKMNESLQDEGFLVIEVPNANSLENKIFKKNSYLYDVPRHLYDFCPITIGALLKKAGFEVRSMCFPYHAGGWIGSIQNILFKGKVYADLRAHIFTFLVLSQIFFPVEYFLSKTTMGSIMTIFAQKINEPRYDAYCT